MKMAWERSKQTKLYIRNHTFSFCFGYKYYYKIKGQVKLTTFTIQLRTPWWRKSFMSSTGWSIVSLCKAILFYHLKSYKHCENPLPIISFLAFNQRMVELLGIKQWFRFSFWKYPLSKGNEIERNWSPFVLNWSGFYNYAVVCTRCQRGDVKQKHEFTWNAVSVLFLCT